MHVCQETSGRRGSLRHTTPHNGEKGGKEERGKRSRHKHGNQRDMRQEVRIKEQEERREGISSLIFLLSPLRTFQSSLV